MTPGRADHPEDAGTMRGHDETGLIREIYHNDPAHGDASELLTELVLPIR